MANIHQYANQSDYAAAIDRPNNESNISLVGNTVVADGVNVVVAYKACNLQKGDAIAYDTVKGKVVGIKNPLSSALDTTRFLIFGYYYGCSSGKGNVLAKGNVNQLWAQSHLYTITPTLTANGGFKFTCSINGSSKSGTISWSANATLASVISQINTAAGTTIAATITGVSGVIGITINSYTNANFAITEATGAVLDVLSKYVTIDGVAQAETARSFQATLVNTLFPSLGYTGATTESRMKNGGNGGYRAGANLARYMAYWQTNGVATYAAETGSDIINKATFDGFATATGDAKALYDKYNGSWAAYMANRMADSENMSPTAVSMMYYDNGDEMTAKLASVMTKGLDGSWIPAYPAAYYAHNYSVADVPVAAAGKWHLNTTRDITEFMEDTAYAAINKSANATSGTALSNTAYYWSVSENINYYAWFYYGYNGTLNYNYKYLSFQVRPSLALPFES